MLTITFWRRGGDCHVEVGIRGQRVAGAYFHPAAIPQWTLGPITVPDRFTVQDLRELADDLGALATFTNGTPARDTAPAGARAIQYD